MNRCQFRHRERNCGRIGLSGLPTGYQWTKRESFEWKSCIVFDRGQRTFKRRTCTSGFGRHRGGCWSRASNQRNDFTLWPTWHFGRTFAIERMMIIADSYSLTNALFVDSGFKVNNAGIIARGTLENTSMEDYDNVMNVNTRAVFHLTKLAIPHLKKSKGNVVNVSSVNGLRSVWITRDLIMWFFNLIEHFDFYQFAGVIAYNMSKAALDQLTRCAALGKCGKEHFDLWTYKSDKKGKKMKNNIEQSSKTV